MKEVIDAIKSLYAYGYDFRLLAVLLLALIIIRISDGLSSKERNFYSLALFVSFIWVIVYFHQEHYYPNSSVQKLQYTTNYIPDTALSLQAKREFPVFEHDLGDGGGHDDGVTGYHYQIDSINEETRKIRFAMWPLENANINDTITGELPCEENCASFKKDGITYKISLSRLRYENHKLIVNLKLEKS